MVDLVKAGIIPAGPIEQFGRTSGQDLIAEGIITADPVLNRQQIAALPEAGPGIALGQTGLTQGSTLAQRLKAGFGSFFAFDPEAQANIISKQLGLETFKQPDGNVIFRNPETGDMAQLNRENLSFQDIAPFVGTAAAFAPAAGVASLGGNLLSRLGIAGAASGATDVGLQVAEQQLGSGKRFQTLRTAAATSGGLAGELLAPVGAAFARAFSNFRRGSGSLDEVGKELAENAGIDINNLSREQVANINQIAARSPDPETALRQVQQIEFNLPATTGEQTSGIKQLRLEQNLDESGLLTGFRGRQQTAQQQAIEQTTERLTGDIPRTLENTEVGQNMLNAVRGTEESLSQRASNLFEQAFSNNGKFKKDFVNVTNSRIKEALADQGSLLPDGTSTIPAVNGLLNTVNRLSRGSKTDPISLNQIEMVRRRISGALGKASGSDRDALGTMLTSFDDSIREAVDGALYSGDRRFLEEFVNARQFFKEYAKVFRIGGKDGSERAGTAIIQKLVDDNTPPEAAVNFIFGLTKASKNPQNSISAIRQLTSVLDDEGKQAIQQAAISRLYSAQTENAILNDFQALKPLLRELFGAKGTAELGRLSNAISSIRKASTNPSGSGREGFALLGDTVKKSLQMILPVGLGLGTGGVPGGLGGAAIATGALAMPSIRRFLNARAAQKLSLDKIRPGGVTAAATRIAAPVTAESLIQPQI